MKAYKRLISIDPIWSLYKTTVIPLTKEVKNQFEHKDLSNSFYQKDSKWENIHHTKLPEFQPYSKLKSNHSN